MAVMNLKSGKEVNIFDLHVNRVTGEIKVQSSEQELDGLTFKHYHEIKLPEDYGFKNLKQDEIILAIADLSHIVYCSDWCEEEEDFEIMEFEKGELRNIYHLISTDSEDEEHEFQLLYDLNKEMLVATVDEKYVIGTDYVSLEDITGYYNMESVMWMFFDDEDEVLKQLEFKCELYKEEV